MEFPQVNNTLNATIQRNQTSQDSEQPPNAFGIGSANRQEVEISPQARVLQQLDQNQQQRQNTLEQRQQEAEANAEEPAPTTEFVRVSSSVGRGSQSNGLTAEEALEVYRSIEGLL